MSQKSPSQTRVILYGCGLMGQVIVRYLYEKGFNLVGVIDSDRELVGRDAGEVAGLGKDLGVVVTADADGVLDAGADIAILTLMSIMCDMDPFFAACAQRGINVISTCEEAFFPRTTSPAITERLDAIARENNCTLTGSGYQDVYWGNLITTIAGSIQRIDRIEGYSSYNVDHYGIALARVHGVGLTLDHFKTEIAEANLPSFAMNVPGWIAGQLGFTITGISQELIPATLPDEIKSTTLGRAIPPGDVIGMNARATASTAEGIDIVMEVCGKVYLPDEVDHNDWTIHGEPTTTVKVAAPQTVELTCATIVNRLPQVISAKPGFVTLESLPRAQYLPVISASSASSAK